MKKIFAIAALAAMFTLTSCGCGNGNNQATDTVDSTAVEVVDSLSVDTVEVADTVVETVAE